MENKDIGTCHEKCINENLDSFPIPIFTKFMTSLAGKLLEI
jgi:hypothetical protein